MIKTGVEFYIFYHDKRKLLRGLGGLTDRRFRFIDLSKVPVPPRFVIPNLSEAENRAILSEYLGYFGIDPKSEMVGLFTYSIPLKFSYNWARESGEFPSLLPPIDFDGISQVHFERSNLYAVELSDPRRGFPAEIEVLHKNFRVGNKAISPLGPYKGSIVISREAFLRFRDWFEEVVEFHIGTFDWRAVEASSEFSLSKLAEKSIGELHVGRFRSGLGGLLERSVAYYFGQVIDDGNKISLRDRARETSEIDDLAEVVHSVKMNNTVIVVFANTKYRKVLENWILGVRRLGISNFVIVAMDKNLHRWLLDEKIACFYYESSNDFGHIWISRIQLLKSIVDMGVDFIHSDADAVWLRNPFRYLRRYRRADFVISQGTVWPRDVFERWGFVVCCGFFMVRSSEKMSKFFSLLLHDVRQTSDDQLSLNRFLQNDEIVWRFREKYPVMFSGDEIWCDRKAIKGRGKHLSVVVLPQILFQRVHSPQENPYVKHILSAKTQRDSLDVLKECGCYFLDQDRSSTSLRPIEWVRHISRRMRGAILGRLERS